MLKLYQILWVLCELHNTFFYVNINVTFKGDNVKTIDRIIIFKKDGKPTDGIVLFADSSFKELEYKKLVKDIIKFSNQEKCTIDDLYHEKKINVYRNYNTYNRIINILEDRRTFTLSKKTLKRWLPIIAIISS